MVAKARANTWDDDMTTLDFDYQPLDDEVAWARALFAKHSAEVTPEFVESLIEALEPRGDELRVKEVPAPRAPKLVFYHKLPRRFVELLSTLGTG